MRAPRGPTGISRGMAAMLRGSTSPGPIRSREATPAAQCGRLRNRAGVRCACKAISGLEVAVSAAAAIAAGEKGVGEKGLAERLRLGSLLPDGLSYKECFIIRCYEVGINKTATVETIANLLQVLIKIPIFR